MSVRLGVGWLLAIEAGFSILSCAGCVIVVSARLLVCVCRGRTFGFAVGFAAVLVRGDGTSSIRYSAILNISDAGDVGIPERCAVISCALVVFASVRYCET